MSSGALVWLVLGGVALAFVLPWLGDVAARQDERDRDLRGDPHDDRTRDTWWWGGHGRPGG